MNADSIAVIRARLPYVDRRALSEAWFSALHLAHAEKSAPRRERKAAASQGSGGVPSERRAANRGALDPAHRSLSFAARHPRAIPLEASSARSRRLGGAVVAAFPMRRVRYAPVRASFHIGVGGGRVQIVLRRDGAVLHVVAVCSRRHVELVRRALACADLHLRLRGETIRSSVRTLEGAGA